MLHMITHQLFKGGHNTVRIPLRQREKMKLNILPIQLPLTQSQNIGEYGFEFKVGKLKKRNGTFWLIIDL